MRFNELNIVTQRQPPARARTEGEAMLRRAGYISPENEATPLGRAARARLEELEQTRPPEQVFALLELPVVRTDDGSFYFAISNGRQDLLQCKSCAYASPLETARFRKVADAGEALLPLEKVATPECNTIQALANFLGIPETKTCKALMYTRPRDGKFVFAAVRGDMQLSEAKLRQQVGGVRAATAEEIIAAGAAPGYASPIGLKDALVIADELIPASPNLVAGANQAGYHLKNTNCGRDYSPDKVADLAMAGPGAPCPVCGDPLSLLRAELLMDSGGYHVNNMLEALAEAHHDEKGLTLPAPAAPFAIYLMHVPGKELDTKAQAARLHDEWENAGIRVLFDDRDERAGVKFADADLIGCPMRATVGERAMKDGMVELKPRTGRDVMLVPFAEAIPTIQAMPKRAP